MSCASRSGPNVVRDRVVLAGRCGFALESMRQPRSDSGQFGRVVHPVPFRFLVRVNPGRWHPVGEVVEHDRLPALLFEHRMVLSAHEGAVVDAGASGDRVIRNVMSLVHDKGASQPG